MISTNDGRREVRGGGWVCGENFESQAPREAVPLEIHSILRISNTLIL